MSFNKGDLVMFNTRYYSHRYSGQTALVLDIQFNSPPVLTLWCNGVTIKAADFTVLKLTENT